MNGLSSWQSWAVHTAFLEFQCTDGFKKAFLPFSASTGVEGKRPGRAGVRSEDNQVFWQ